MNGVRLNCRQYVLLDFLLYHSNISRAETYYSTVYLYCTKYVVFEHLVWTNFTGAAPNFTNMTDNQGVSITVCHRFLLTATTDNSTSNNNDNDN